ncbi:unnamed protein product, partial [marine sediment metagenome]
GKVQYGEEKSIGQELKSLPISSAQLVQNSELQL